MKPGVADLPASWPLAVAILAMRPEVREAPRPGDEVAGERTARAERPITLGDDVVNLGHSLEGNAMRRRVVPDARPPPNPHPNTPQHIPGAGTSTRGDSTAARRDRRPNVLRSVG